MEVQEKNPDPPRASSSPQAKFREKFTFIYEIQAIHAFVHGFDSSFGNPFDPQVLSNDDGSFFPDGDRSIAGVGTDVGWHDAAI